MCHLWRRKIAVPSIDDDFLLMQRKKQKEIVLFLSYPTYLNLAETAQLMHPHDNNLL